MIISRLAVKLFQLFLRFPQYALVFTEVVLKVIVSGQESTVFNNRFPPLLGFFDLLQVFQANLGRWRLVLGLVNIVLHSQLTTHMKVLYLLQHCFVNFSVELRFCLPRLSLLRVGHKVGCDDFLQIEHHT